MARRNIKIDLRLNEQEMERLRRDVARSGWSREKYLRALIEHSVIKEMPSMDLVAVLRNLQQINNNINQIALVANTKGFIDTAAYWENVDHLKKTIHELLEVMYGSWHFSPVTPMRPGESTGLSRSVKKRMRRLIHEKGRIPPGRCVYGGAASRAGLGGAWPPSGRHSAKQHRKSLRTHADRSTDHVPAAETRRPGNAVPGAAIGVPAGREHSPFGADHDDR